MITKELLFGKTSLPAVGKSMNAAMLRSKALAQNIANVQTPGFKRVEVNFERDLRRALDKVKIAGAKTDPKHLDLGKPEIHKVRAKAYRPDDPTLPSGENNVDIDMENAKLAENQILYNFEVRFAGERFKAVQQSIKGSRTP